MYVQNVMTHTFWLMIFIATAAKLKTVQWVHYQESFQMDRLFARNLKDKNVQSLQRMLVTVKSVKQIISI